ncbi:MAG: hypothetical protein GY769_18525 [bacterium]|nr:hypothetical protein [bacterium]
MARKAPPGSGSAGDRQEPSGEASAWQGSAACPILVILGLLLLLLVLLTALEHFVASARLSSDLDAGRSAELPGNGLATLVQLATLLIAVVGGA